MASVALWKLGIQVVISVAHSVGSGSSTWLQTTACCESTGRIFEATAAACQLSSAPSAAAYVAAVSYTHLTLPTILRV